MSMQFPYTTWATYAFLEPRYGYLTLNVVESLNRCIGTNSIPSTIKDDGLYLVNSNGDYL